VIRELVEDGFEVGVHGLLHDGRDFQFEEMVRRRLPERRAYAARWRVRASAHRRHIGTGVISGERIE
jgi:hypothetical protein